MNLIQLFLIMSLSYGVETNGIINNMALDSLYHVRVVETTRYSLENTPKVKLPKELSLDDGVHGKAIASVWIEECGNIKWHALNFLSLKTENDECFIKYRHKSDTQEYKEVDIDCYPTPIQPYVIFFRKKSLELKFKEDKSAPKQKVYLGILFEIY